MNTKYEQVEYDFVKFENSQGVVLFNHGDVYQELIPFVRKSRRGKEIKILDMSDSVRKAWNYKYSKLNPYLKPKGGK